MFNPCNLIEDNTISNKLISSLNIQNCNEQNLLSVMNQSFQDFEIIIVNDASEDKTKSIINLFQSNDEIIQLLSNQNK